MSRRKRQRITFSDDGMYCFTFQMSFNRSVDCCKSDWCRQVMLLLANAYGHADLEGT